MARAFYKSSVTSRWTSKDDPNAIIYIAVPKDKQVGENAKKSIRVSDSRILQQIKSDKKHRQKLSAEAREKRVQYNEAKLREKISDTNLTEIKSSTDMDITTRLISGKSVSTRLRSAIQELKVEFGDDGLGEATLEEPKQAFNKYSYKLEQKSKSDRYSTGTIFNRQKQEEIIELFNKANIKLEEHRQKYGIDLGSGFKLYENSTPFSIERKIIAAEQILNDDYVERLANSYKMDAVENFVNHVDREVIRELLDSLIDVDPIEYLRYIKQYDLGYIAHAYDSDLDEAQYQRLDATVKEMIKDLNAMKKISVKEPKNERVNKS